MLKLSLSDYSDVCILAKETITIPGKSVAEDPGINRNTKVILKNCAPFSDCIREINNIRVDNARDVDAVVPMYNLI